MNGELERVLSGTVLDHPCGMYLMESQWEEGFQCSLPAGHDGHHRAEGGVHDVNEGVDESGRKYQWVHEWWY